MANITTVTRPYAKAVLAIAKEHKTYEKWSQLLELLSAIANDPLGMQVLSNLAMSPNEKVAFIRDVAGDLLTPEALSLINILARAKRLLILPELSRLYAEMLRHEENITIIDLTVTNDDSSEIANIQDICNNSFKGEVVINRTIDPMLIGGGVAQIGNRVIDASVLGRLAAMRNLLRK